MKPAPGKGSSKLRESLRYIRKIAKSRPRIAVILGSGLGDFADSLTDKTAIDTSSIPHYPESTIEGHKGRLVFGKSAKTHICVLQGRVHFYETGNLESVLYPVSVLRLLGIKTLILTNASGGINKNFKPGDLMLIRDHINLTFENPLSPVKDSPSRRLRRASRVYDEDLIMFIKKAAVEKGIQLKEGVYCGLKGPSYETAAEIEMIRRIGGDAAGMSTVNEASFAAALGMRVAGISCITNLSTGTGTGKLTHEDVTEVANRVKNSFADLLNQSIRLIRQ